MDWSTISTFLTLRLILYNITTGQEKKITSGKNLKGFPHIFGDIIVFTEYKKENGDIYLFNLYEEQKIPVCTTESWQGEAFIYMNKIVWVEGDEGNATIYIYDISTKQISPNR